MLNIYQPETEVARPYNLESLAQALERAAGACRHEAGRLGAVVARLEQSESDLKSWATAVRASQLSELPPPRAIRAALAETRRAARLRAAAKQIAVAGISSLKVSRRKSGGVVALIDGKQLGLPPELADLLESLAEHALESEDFIPHRVLTARLSLKAERPITQGARRQLVYRLRETFLAAGLSRDLVESHSTRGVRLRIRRG